MIIESAEYPSSRNTLLAGPPLRVQYPRTVRWVKQEDEKGCGIAALAMVLGQTYKFVRCFFPGIVYGGLHLTDCAPFLAMFGCGLHWENAQKDGSAAWRNNDWSGHEARVHLCLVDVSLLRPSRHYVVWLRDGTVLDPAHDGPRRLREYPRVLSVGTIIDPD